MGAMVRMAGGQFKVVPCPAVATIGSSVPVCVNEVVMMPSSRVECGSPTATERPQSSRLAATVPPPPSKMVGLTMGSPATTWPAVDLAKVQFNQSGAAPVHQQAARRQRLHGRGRPPPAERHLHGRGSRSARIGSDHDAARRTRQRRLRAAAEGPSPAHLLRLLRRHRERHLRARLRGSRPARQGRFPGSQKPAPDQLEQFDPSHTTVCLPLGPGQTPVHETWELVQLSTENHNFHIHQTAVRRVTGSNGGVIAGQLPARCGGADATIADQVANNQNGVCTVAAMAQRPLRLAAGRLRHPVRASSASSSTTATSSNTRTGA